jgi:sulfhydrogenase subunit beta (sulfur reductase)
MTTVPDLLRRVLQGGGGDYAVFAPVAHDYGVFIERISRAEDVSLDHVLTRNTLKDVMLPSCEPLACYDLEKGALAPVEEEAKTIVVVGTRPCDAAAQAILDKILGGETADKRSMDRRRRSIMVTVACSKADPACFCTSMGYGPHDETGSDVLLLPGEGGYLVRAVTDRGRAFLSEIGIVEDREAKVAPPPEVIRKVKTEGLKAWLDKHFDHCKWEEVSENCLSCGICYYLCPTCHCYEIVDEAGLTKGERLRVWDACSFKGFTKMASHQPRVGRHARYRQRIMHKFKYTVDNVGETACVGDGRCIRFCPVGVDITEILEKLMSEEEA